MVVIFLYINNDNGNVVPKGSTKHRELYPEDFK